MKNIDEKFERSESGLFVPRRERSRGSDNSELIRIARKYNSQMFDGPFWMDVREPFFVANLSAITLATTAKALYAAKDHPPLGPNYFNRYGKRLGIYASGAITTAATPGNGSFDLYWGSGADANGTLIASSAALALTASQTNLSWWIELFIRCTTPGSSGFLEVSGRWGANPGVLSGTLQPATIPASAAAPVAADLTPNNILSLQFKRSGSTAETMDVRDLMFYACN
jgi:hypothetical protein